MCLKFEFNTGILSQNQMRLKGYFRKEERNRRSRRVLCTFQKIVLLDYWIIFFFFFVKNNFSLWLCRQPVHSLLLRRQDVRTFSFRSKDLFLVSRNILLKCIQIQLTLTFTLINIPSICIFDLKYPIYILYNSNLKW